MVIRLPLVALTAGFLASAGAHANIVTYRFTGNILEAPVEFTDLAYNSGPDPLVFTLVVNTGIPAEQIDDSPPPVGFGVRFATYTSAIVSATVELGGTAIATSDAGTAGRTRQYGGGFAGDRDIFQYLITDPGDFSSGPVLGLSPTSLTLDIRDFTTSAFASLALPDPFPGLAGFQQQEFRMNFGAPATQPLFALLSGVTTTSVIPVPAAAWFFGSAVAVLGGVLRRRADGVSA